MKRREEKRKEGLHEQLLVHRKHHRHQTAARGSSKKELDLVVCAAETSAIRVNRPARWAWIAAVG